MVEEEELISGHDSELIVSLWHTGPRPVSCTDGWCQYLGVAMKCKHSPQKPGIHTDIVSIPAGLLLWCWNFYQKISGYMQAPWGLVL